MEQATAAAIKMYSAFGGASVDVVTCGACARETVVSPAVAAENGLPGRCPGCGSGELRAARYRVVRGAVEPADVDRRAR